MSELDSTFMEEEKPKKFPIKVVLPIFFKPGKSLKKNF